MKRLAICADGTWNTPEQRDRGKIRPTNIVKLSRAVKQRSAVDGLAQITYYDEGVGTHWGVSRWVEGATGLGISKNILRAYRFLCLNFESGDEIYLFGFSRGAYTVRSLAGLIDAVGILPPNHAFYTPEAYALYQKRDSSESEIAEFREARHAQPTRIRFLGVFDTVGALGIPASSLNWITAKRHRFHDVRFNPSVDHGYHALAIDEHRRDFAASLWDPEHPTPMSQMEQVWYAGVHSNIGGGYDPDGLANLPLQSIKKRAEALGLDLDNAFLGHFKGVPTSELRKSRKGIYRLKPKYFRPIGTTKHGNERVHQSVADRMAALGSDYQPRNLP